MSAARQDFDRSFDTDFVDQSASNDNADFISNDAAFLFSPLPETQVSTHYEDHEHTALFPDDPFCDSAMSSAMLSTAATSIPSVITAKNKSSTAKSKSKRSPVVKVALREIVSATYDGMAQEGTISVRGSVHVKVPASGIVQTDMILALNDASGSIHSVRCTSEENNKNVFCPCSYSLAQNGAHLLHLELPRRTPNETENTMPVATYTCHPKVRPVPLLIKSRVSTSSEFLRVGFKVRANPNNVHNLTHVTIILAVPPNVDGSSAKMSRPGASWEELKRTMTWRVDLLERGKALEIQAQFPVMDVSSTSHDPILAALSGPTNASSSTAAAASVPVFPILVRCDYPEIFTGARIAAVDEAGVGIVTNSLGRVLHRKV